LKIKIYLEKFKTLFQDSIFATNRNAQLYIFNAVLGGFTGNLIYSTNNNLFASRLGADDYQLSLLLSIPMLISMVILIPGGFLTDALRSKRSMIVGALSAAVVLYLGIGFLPFFIEFKFNTFLLFMAAVSVSSSLCSISASVYFAEAVVVENRNRIITVQTFISSIMGIIIPLITGLILTGLKTNEGKIIAHQSFFIFAALIVFSQIFVFRKINAVVEVPVKKISFGMVKEAGSRLIRNKKFLLYSAVYIFFYAVWTMDSTLTYISLTQYLQFDEVMLSYISVSSTVA